MRQATFTELSRLSYLCTIIPSGHYLNERFTYAQVMLAARIEVGDKTDKAYVSFYSESEVRDMLEILGYPFKTNDYIEQFIHLAEKMRADLLGIRHVTNRREIF